MSNVKKSEKKGVKKNPGKEPEKGLEKAQAEKKGPEKGAEKVEKKVKAPVRWYGGKHKLAGRIVEIIDRAEYKSYIEPFGGAASVLIRKEKKRGELEVYNDIDSTLVNLFDVISRKDLFDEFCRRVSLLPLSRELYLNYTRDYAYQSDPVEKAVMYFVAINQAHGGHIRTGWSYAKKGDSCGAVEDWLSRIENLSRLHERLQGVQIDNRHFKDVFDVYDTEDAFFYVDPPYRGGDREEGSRDKYAFEMSSGEWQDLIDILVKIKGSAVVSGYWNSMMFALEDAGYERTDIPVKISAGHKGGEKCSNRTESLWVRIRKEKKQDD